MIIDAHLDTILQLQKYPSLRKIYDSHCDYQRLCKYLDVAFFAVFIHPRKYAACPLPELMRYFGTFKQDLSRNRDLVELLLYKEQLKSSKSKILLGVEGGDFIGDDQELLTLMQALGLRFLGLTWNHDNQLAAACGSQQGLTSWGKQVIKQCNDLDIIVDLAHASERSFWNALAVSNQPIMVSHAACNACHSHRRNLNDHQLKELGRAGGVVGITFVKDFLASHDPDLDDIVRHIVHAVEVAGIDAVGIGSDFDGAEVAALKGVEDLPFLWLRLREAGFSQEELDKIAGDNFLRFLQGLLPNKEKGHTSRF
ncbi:MAG: dipeptidase [Bacillota bacterium]|jgi:membrane dipeptidase